MVVNILLVAGKLAAGLLGHSHALVADAVESMADIFSSIVVWRGLVVAAEPADDDHPYGHGKAEPLASTAVSTMLLLAAAGIVATAFRSMLGPRHPGPSPYTLLVLIGVVVIKESLFHFVKGEAETVESTAVKTDAWHHRSDAITSLAAAIGITISWLGGPSLTGADDVAAIVAAGIIAFNGARQLRPALNELMDATPNSELIQIIRTAAAAIPGVERVEKCFVRKMGHRYFVDMHIEVAPQLTVQEGHRISHLVKDHVRDKFPAVRDVLVHIEPVGANPPKPQLPGSSD
jgi:cation diffusion facilitator family transporter